jgi:Putative quorum-sensing-regulated virulence factor
MAGLFFRLMIPDKAMKCLNLALNHAALEGEWNAAAIRFVAILRASNIGIESINGNPVKRSTTHSIVMPFGKFKGSPIADLPDWYLAWCLEQDFIKGPLRSALEQEDEERN